MLTVLDKLLSKGKNLVERAVVFIVNHLRQSKECFEKNYHRFVIHMKKAQSRGLSTIYWFGVPKLTLLDRLFPTSELIPDAKCAQFQVKRDLTMGGILPSI